jgi:hypothetical protein
MQSIRFGVLSRAAPEDWELECVRRLREAPGVELAFTASVAEDGRLLAGPTSTSASLPPSVSAPGLSDVLRQLDCLLWLDDAPVPASLATAPAHGIWRFHYGDWVHYRGGPGGFWELHDGAVTSAAMLVRLTPDPDSVIVLREGHLRTERSVRRNREQWHRLFVDWAVQAVADVQHGRLDRHSGRPSVSSRRRGAPGFLARSTCRARTFFARARSLLRDLFVHEQWNVGLIRSPIHAVLSGTERLNIEWFDVPRRHEFLADPFGVMRDGKLTVLCEYLDQRHPRGVIVATDERGSAASRTPVQIGPDAPVHLSYPYLLEVDGKLLCVPETNEAREVALYELVEFPNRWRKIATLLRDRSLVDATPFFFAGLWWLAASEVAAKGKTSELHLWWAPQLEGPWTPHAQNPVKVDVRSARPGGTPFVHEGVLYRPAQDCAATYGSRIVVNRVLELTPEEFREEMATAFEPDRTGPRPAGLHTLSAAGGYTLIDGKRFLFVPEEFWRAARFAMGAVTRARPVKSPDWVASR